MLDLHESGGTLGKGAGSEQCWVAALLDATRAEEMGAAQLTFESATYPATRSEL